MKVTAVARMPTYERNANARVSADAMLKEQIYVGRTPQP